MKPQLNKGGRDERAAWSVADCWAFGQAMGVLLLLVIFILLALVSFAKADALPKVMLGHWCLLTNVPGAPYFYDPASSEQKCPTRYLSMRRTGFVGYETDEKAVWCSFIKVSYTGRKSAPHTKPLPHELVPVMRVTAECVEMDDSRHRTTFELSYQKGSLVFDPK